MKKTAAHSATSPNNSQSTQSINLFDVGRESLAIGWRIVVPAVLCAVFGAFGDSRFGSKPWLTLMGLVVGLLVAGFLLRRELGDPEAADKKRT